MTYEEMRKYIADMVKSQGSQGAIEIAPLLYAMADKMFADPETGVVPIVVSIAEVGNKEGTATRYDITTDQQTINEYIDNVTEEKAKARLFIQDGDALIGFTYLEINGTTITGQSIAPDGSYKLYLSKETGTSYFEHDDEVKSIASVTEAEITGYNEMFGATYDPVNNQFTVQIGTVSAQLTPGQMMLTTEEYNKVSNDADYTAMWAYAIAEYICCPPWFEGFAGFKLHSAFYKAEKTIFIDLNAVELSVVTLASAFYGCSRLEQITGILKIASNVPLTDAFKGCAVLHTVKLSGLFFVPPNTLKSLFGSLFALLFFIVNNIVIMFPLVSLNYRLPISRQYPCKLQPDNVVNNTQRNLCGICFNKVAEGVLQIHIHKNISKRFNNDN
jgi:hypothetical protein